MEQPLLIVQVLIVEVMESFIYKQLVELAEMAEMEVLVVLPK